MIVVIKTSYKVHVMKIGFVIPSRLKSSRLKRKNLIYLNEQTALEWAIDRAKLVNGIDEVVVATTALESDSEVSRICLKKGIRYCQSSPDDVILRIRDTARYFDFDYIVNITPDNTLFSMYLADLIVKEIKEDRSIDFVKYKDALLGTGIYALKREAVETVCDFKTITDTEIWGVLFNDKFFNVKVLNVPNFLQSNYRLTLDTEDDYRMISTIYHDMNIRKNNIPELYEIIEYLDAHSEVASINQGVVQSTNTDSLIDKVNQLFEEHKEEFFEIHKKYYGGSL